MSDAPARHPDVPRNAIWRMDVERWEVVARGPGEVREGECRLYRADGTLAMQSAFVAGVEEGPFATFHPNGEVARQGRFRAGEMDGQVVTRVATRGEGEPLRSCCVPENAVEMRSVFDRGQMVSERFFDAEGLLLLSDGSHAPPRPANLPEEADFDEGAGRWIVGPRPGSGDNLVRFYRQDGGLDEEAIIETGCKLSSRRFAADGSVKAEENFARDGRRAGSHRQRFVDGDESPYADARIVEVRGQYQADRPAGRWTFHDGDGALVATVEHGDPAALVAADFPEVFADEARDPAAWNALAERLAEAGHSAFALCAAARGAARAGETDALSALLRRLVVALKPAAAIELAQRARELSEKAVEPVVALPIELLSALVAGGDAAEVFRELSGLHRQNARAAFDLAEASLLLAPERPIGFFTRALARIELGDDGGTLADARRLEPASPDSAQFLRSYLRTLYPEWGFWPAHEQFGDEVAEGVPDEPGQPLAAIVRVMQVYATRLGALRAAVVAKAPNRARAAWLPPALPELLPEGPVALTRFEATIIDETDAGPESVAVTIDETLALEGASLPTLMQMARGQWAALTWLTAAVGLGQPALPTEIAPPPTFAAMAVAAITRYFRVQDAVATGGLRSRTAGVPGFSWHGIDVDELSRPAAEVALAETRELRALFLWLLSPENHSPFQSDLRDG
jgi:hypothetical protein